MILDDLFDDIGGFHRLAFTGYFLGEPFLAIVKHYNRLSSLGGKFGLENSERFRLSKALQILSN